MRVISENLLKKIQSDTRAYDIMLTVYHRYIDADGNISFDTSTDYSSNAELLGVSGLQGATTGYLQLGKTFVSEIDFSLTKNAVCRVGDKVKLWLDFGDGDTITLATAYVDTVSHDQWQSNFTAYDKMMQLNKAYISKLTYPASASAVVDEICEQTGLELESFVFECNPTLKVAPVSPNTDYNGNSVYYSYREILGYIALANASNVVIDEETEKLKFVKYTNSGSTFDYNKTIRRTINNENYVINAIKVSDTGYSEGNTKGEFEVFFPLITTQGKEYVYSYLSTHFVGLSYIGMTAQKQGYGVYQIGDLVNYADFDGQNYTFAVMGVKYDFSGGYFTEQLYSLAPSEMEAEYSGSIYAGQSNTNIKNPVIISEKSKSYLKYDYTSVGYIKGDESSYGSEYNDIINHGYIFANKRHSNNQIYSTMEFERALYNDNIWKNLKVESRLEEVETSGYKRYRAYYSYVDESENFQEIKTNVTIFTKPTTNVGIYPNWTRIYAPSEEYPYGRVLAHISMTLLSDDGSAAVLTGNTVFSDIYLPFANINEYNMAVQLTNQPLVMYDVTQNVLQVVEGNNYADLPEIGTVDTLYVTYQPPAVYKYSTVTQSYYCVGRNYKEIQRIVSTTKPDDNEVATYKVPIVFDVRTKAEWELEANTVFPKGFVILEQEPETREKTRIKIANGIDKLSDLDYNGIDETDLSEKADKSELQAHIDDKNNPHEVTKAQIGLSKVENKSSADILSELEVGVANLLKNSNFSDGINNWQRHWTSAVTDILYSIENDSTYGSYLLVNKQYGENYAPATYRIVQGTHTKGQQYALSFYAKATNDTVLSIGEIGLNSLNFNIGTEWTRYSGTYTATGIAFSIVIPNQDISISLTKIKLEKGNKATDWTPAPEDVETRVTSLEERVATLEAALLSLGGEI